MSHNVAEIRERFPAATVQAYMNTGSAGPLSRTAVEAVANWNERQYREGRSNPSVSTNELAPMADDLRTYFGKLINAQADEIALTSHTTNGMNIATWGINWQVGDEVVTASGEHPGGLMPVYAAAHRFNLTVRVVEQETNDDSNTLLEKFRQAINPRTKLVSLSHVAWKTGHVLPVKKIAEIAHTFGALVVVDGAQSVGALDLDVKNLNIDFYAMPGQKWLCGPEGTGALYVKKACIPDVSPTFVGYRSMRDGDSLDASGHFLPAPGAKRYEMGTVYWPGIAGQLAGLKWFDQLGFSWISERVQHMTRSCRTMLDKLPFVEIVTPDTHAGLTSFRVDGLAPTDVVSRLAEQNIVVRSVSNPDLVRTSTHFFNDESDIDALRKGLCQLV